MLKIVAIVWQSYYNMLLKASKDIKDFSVKVYSIRALENERQKLEDALKELDDADIVFFYRSNESVWEEIERKVKEGGVKGKIVCLGHDPSYWTLSNWSRTLRSL